MEEEIKANEPNPQMESDHIKGLSLENKSEQLDVPNEIIVSDPTIKEGIKAYVIYTITYKPSNEKMLRRYSDFHALRNKLRERWPGVYIPKIPQKQVTGNLDTKTIEMRMRLLNKFCLKLTNYPHLFYSDEVKCFITNHSDVVKSINSLSTSSYLEIYTKYYKIFYFNSSTFNFQTSISKINEFQNFLKKTQGSLKHFKETVYNSLQKKQGEIDSYLNLLDTFTDFEKFTLLEYTENDDRKLILFNPNNTDLCLKLMKLKNGLDNPYTDLFEWLETEEIDNEAMIETIQSLNQLRETQEKLKGKLVSMENDLNTLKAGKSNIKSIFSFKSKAEDIQSLENSKQNLETNLDHLDKIILIATHNLNNHITNYKEKKLNEYYAHLKLFTQLQMSVSKEMNEIWSLISSDKNLQ